MTEAADPDALLHDLLSIPERSSDEAFVLRIEKRALAEQRLRAAGQVALRRFAAQVAALVSVAAAFLLIRSMGTAVSDHAILFSGSFAAGLMLLLVWLCVDAEEFLPLASGSARPRDEGRPRLA